jgi:hypothetical protein
MKGTLFLIMKKTLILASAVALAVVAGSAQAQLSAWRLNEIGTRTIGGTAATRSQFVELYHPVAGQSVTGLSIIVIRPNFSEGGTFAYREDLTGTATGNFFVIGNQNFANNFGTQNQTAATTPSFMRPGGATQGQFQEVYLVLTSSILPSYSPVSTTPANAYSFAPTDFNSGADLIDGVYLCGSDSPNVAGDNGCFIKVSPPDPNRLAVHPNPSVLGAAPPSAYRTTDGTGPWLGTDIAGGVEGQFPVGSTPGASNAGTNVSDWTLY